MKTTGPVGPQNAPMRSGGSIRIAENADEAAWIAGLVGPFASGVGGLVPRVFGAYARVFHPAHAWDGSEVRWATVAASSGRTMHALAEFIALSPEVRTSAGHPVLQPPSDGELPPTTLATLVDDFARYTSTPDDCHFGVWEGYGGAAAALHRAAKLRLPERTYLLLRGPLRGVQDIGWQWDSGSFHQRSPNLMWPSDRAWFLASEIDLDSTFVGGSAELVAALIADPGLEAWPVSPADPITADSDLINRDRHDRPTSPR